MMQKRKILCVFSFVTVLLFLQVIPVNANSPQSMDLTYDFTNQELTVDIAHEVSDVNSHYIYEVEVRKNSIVVLSKDYTSQNSTSGMLVIYSIATEHGDVLSVTAKCIQSGQITEDLTVVDPSVTTTTPTSPTNGNGFPLGIPLMIAVVIVALGVVMVIVVFAKRR